MYFRETGHEAPSRRSTRAKANVGQLGLGKDAVSGYDTLREEQKTRSAEEGTGKSKESVSLQGLDCEAVKGQSSLVRIN